MIWPKLSAYPNPNEGPRTTAICAYGAHAVCSGSCTPLKEYYLSHESTHETVACECACHPVLVVEE
jgi:hypothetical protein